MSELKLPRLLAAATEFNVGRDTLIDFLGTKGFNKDELKDTTKLSAEMYYAAQAAFSTDKAAKNKADLVEIPKAVSAEARKKRDEEDLSIGKKEITKPAKETPAAPAVVVETVKVAATKVEAKVETNSWTEIIEKVEKIEEPVVVPIIEEKHEEPIAAKEEITRIDAPELDGPKIIAKIDLSTIDSSTKPKKVVKKKKEETAEIKTEPIVETVVEKPKPAKKVEVPIEPIKPQAPKSRLLNWLFLE